MSTRTRWSILAALGWVLCLALGVRLFATAGPNPWWMAQAGFLVVLLVTSGWLTGKAAALRGGASR